MASSLVPCPCCGHPLESDQQECPICQAPSATQPRAEQEPPSTTGLTPGPEKRQTHPSKVFFNSLMFPLYGLILGFRRAFDRDPERKREARFAFGGGGLGVLLLVLLEVFVVPRYATGPASPAYNEGIAAASQGNFAAAETAYKRAVEIDPNFAAAWINLSSAQTQQRNGSGAEMSARKAIELLNSGRIGVIPGGITVGKMKGLAHANRAQALAIQSRIKVAAEEAQQALAVYPDQPSASNLRIIIEAATRLPK